MNGKSYRNRKLIILAVILAGLFFLLVGAITANASKETANGHTKCYTQVYVRPGDTLWGIAKKYYSPEYGGDIRSLVQEIMSINHCGEEIRSGYYVIVPYFAEPEHMVWEDE